MWLESSHCGQLWGGWMLPSEGVGGPAIFGTILLEKIWRKNEIRELV
jgi:hypothetical protein